MEKNNILRIFRPLFIEQLWCEQCFAYVDHFIKMQGCDTEHVGVKAECRTCITPTRRQLTIKEWNGIIPVQKEQLDMFKKLQKEK